MWREEIVNMLAIAIYLNNVFMVNVMVDNMVS